MLLPESKFVSQSDSGCSSFSASSLSLASFFSYSGETWANSLLRFGQILIRNQLIRYIVAMEHNCKASQFEGRWNSCYDSKLSHNHGTPSSCNITVFCSVLDGIVGLGFLRPFQVPGIHVEFIVDHGSIHGACATILGVKSRVSSVLPGVHNKIVVPFWFQFSSLLPQFRSRSLDYCNYYIFPRRLATASQPPPKRHIQQQILKMANSESPQGSWHSALHGSSVSWEPGIKLMRRPSTTSTGWPGMAAIFFVAEVADEPLKTSEFKLFKFAHYIVYFWLHCYHIT